MSQVSQTCGSGTKDESNLLGVAVVAIVDGATIELDQANSIKLSQSTSTESPERDPTNNISSLPYVVKTPRADSKLILQNMEEVLNSVKRKHKQKHRRKKELKKIALQEAEAAAAAENEANAADSTKVSPKSPKHPLQESKKNVEEIGVELKSPMKNASILDHFVRTPKKRHLDCSPSTVKEVTKVVELPKKEEATRKSTKKESTTKKVPAKEVTTKDVIAKDVTAKEVTAKEETPKEVVVPKKANAFEVMMNARNKSIGSNTPGKDPSPTEDPDGCPKIVHIKRKILLQEWADRKGGVKRRLEEEATEAYIETAMKHRAKRFKAMLTNGTESKSDSKPATPVVDKTAEAKSPTKASQSAKTKPVRKPKRSSRFSRRLSSGDSVESVENASQDSTAFLSKLSSPIKKRDSLLGYFPKKTSSPASAEITEVPQKLLPVETVSENITPKRKKGRPPKKHKVNTPIQKEVKTPVNVVVETPEPVTTSTGRPKRQCSRRSRYDQDLSPISSKTEEKKLPPEKPEEKPVARSIKKTPKLDEPEIIDVDSESPKQTPKKLAPLFIKAVPKPSIDPETLRARQEFLMSGVPEKMRLEMAKQKQYEQSYEEAIEEFPSVSHIEQLTPEKITTTPKEKGVIPFKLRPIIEDDDEDQKTPTRKIKRRMIGTFTTCTQKDFRGLAKNMLIGPNPLTQIDNKRQIIKEWKVTYDRFPTFRCYNQLREKYRHFCAVDSEQEAEQFTDSFVVTRSSTRRSLTKEKFDPDAEEEKPPPSAPNGELLFTEKYKAMSSDQVLVNVAPVNQLKEFLSSWRGMARATDSSAFADLNDSSNSNSASSNSVVLLGPNSSGKTNAVFALANEMNFAVLEVNAGMKRTGKKLLQELQEATQSHQVRKNAKSNTKNLLKNTLNGNKKRQSGEERTIEDIEQTRKSLILIEDADVIFEQHDAGFVDALYTLASTSKRPVIIMATNENCQHLQRLINQNTIRFTPPNVLNISKFLSVLSLIENCPVELNDLVSLYLLNRKHLRKTILEMQFYIQSGGDRLVKSIKRYDDKGTSSSEFFVSPNKRRYSEESIEVTEFLAAEDDKNKYVNYHKGLFEFYTVCQNTKCRIPFPVDFHLLRTNLSEIFKVSRNLTETTTRRKSRSPKKAWLCALNRTSVSQALGNFYENLSAATMIAGVQESEDRLTNNLSEEMAHCLVERAIERNLGAGHYAYNLFDSPHDGVTLTNYSPVTPLRSSRSLALDYEPSLRSICRSEKNRSNCERRGSRFYHYLRNSCVNLGSFSTADNFERACDILNDPTDIILLSQTSSSQKSD
ncbi:enhanced level of genomic instability 1 [Episyrphus balteatus]|uniref:enhanced level of genomic instability 1 n=1 Tax=Episyrphus balteatus TaxID=286459 RepID=UPI0024868C40|nr:enhanced level of genomic instability 1 [Episyrphus balteatus]XP_055842015.1 enhanced level of genomic instability 1 [Episyrphus balteatus]